MEIIPAISDCIEYPLNDVSVTPFTSTANISSCIDGFGAPHPDATVGSGVKYVDVSRVGSFVFFGAFVGFGFFVFGAFVGLAVFGAFVGFGFFVFGALVGLGFFVLGALVVGFGSPHPD